MTKVEKLNTELREWIALSQKLTRWVANMPVVDSPQWVLPALAKRREASRKLLGEEG